MAKNIHHFRTKIGSTQPKYLLNVSDVHYDSIKCDRKLLKQHFDKALELDACILINGDWLDVMGMKHDPRSIPNEIRDEYMKSGGSYLDLVVQDSFEFLKKYAKNIIVFGYGNHETNIVKRQQTDPLKWLTYLLNNELEYQGEEHRIELGAYNGAIYLDFLQGTSVMSKKIYYHHGSGGGAKRSKGILNADILVSQNSWADLITSGHDHNKWHLPMTVRDLCHVKKDWKRRKIDIIRTGSYKKKSDTFGWEIEKDFNEPTLGGFMVKYELIRAQTKKENKKEVIQKIIEL